MAKLREIDLERILGPDWRIQTGSAGPGHGRLQAQLNEKRRLDRINDALFTAGGGVAIGIGLVISAFATQKGIGFFGWLGFASFLIVASSIWTYSLRRRRRLGTLRGTQDAAPAAGPGPVDATGSANAARSF